MLTSPIHCRGLGFSTLVLACPVAEHNTACFVRWYLGTPTNWPGKNAETRHWLGSSTQVFLENQNKRFSLTPKLRSITVLAKTLSSGFRLRGDRCRPRAAASDSRRKIILMPRTYRRNAKLEKLGTNLLLLNECEGHERFWKREESSGR
uniref:Secreted protein n=1 Tax=Ixodes ricinus TaxID=34613 RepID=A0A6B0UUT9_IXORI